MNVSEAIKTRRAIRNYTDQELSDEVVDTVVSLALEAPTAFNLQRSDLVVVRDQAVKDGLFAASNQKQLRDAPVVLVVVARTGMPSDIIDILGEDYGAGVVKYFESLDAIKLRETALKDAMLVGAFALIAAQGEGLATSPTTGWDEAKVLEAVGLPNDGEHGVALVIAMGYGNEQPAHPGRIASRRINDHY